MTRAFTATACMTAIAAFSQTTRADSKASIRPVFIWTMTIERGDASQRSPLDINGAEIPNLGGGWRCRYSPLKQEKKGVGVTETVHVDCRYGNAEVTGSAMCHAGEFTMDHPSFLMLTDRQARTIASVSIWCTTIPIRD